MRKGQQLERIRRLGLPTPRFERLSWKAYQEGGWANTGLRFPLAVRSSYAGEDGEQRSHAGAYLTRLEVGAGDLEAAIREVFAAYPRSIGQEVILQEMADLRFGGVLFAYHRSAWKVEWVEGHPAGLVSGQAQPRTLLLPRFSSADRRMARLVSFWGEGSKLDPELARGLIHLAAAAARLLEAFSPRHGLDIEFGVGPEGLQVLQARPISAPTEAEEVLTTANHEEILPPRPSPLMSDLIARAGRRLFGYYRGLDPSLPDRAFIELAAGMPWINLSALLDVMVHWGLPTGLVSRSVGASDPYGVGLRPWRALARLPVFGRLAWRQWGAASRARRWLQQATVAVEAGVGRRRAIWPEAPAAAAGDWVEAFSTLYVGLVSHMQDLTGAMAGPVQLLDRLGWLAPVSRAARAKSRSTDLLAAYRALRSGQLDRDAFLADFGHRGIYESDIGQPRWHELSAEAWAAWLDGGQPASGASGASEREAAMPAPPSGRPPAPFSRLGLWLLGPIIGLIQRREWLRHESMRLFDRMRQEMRQAVGELAAATEGTTGPAVDGELPAATGEPAVPAVDWWRYRVDDLIEALAQPPSRRPAPPHYPEPSGWDMRTFLADRHGRRRPLPGTGNEKGQVPIGIYPGRVRGRVWRVTRADDPSRGPAPPRPRILVANALDPGWVPYFAQVDGVISYTGGLLSHASIILRESGIPAITQAPSDLDLRTGDLIEMDGLSGRVRRIEGLESDS